MPETSLAFVLPPQDRMAVFEDAARSNPAYVDALYREYLREPEGVPAEWRFIFEGYGFGLGARRDSPSVSPAARLVHAYRELGHLIADLDPLGQSPRTHPLLDLDELVDGAGLDDIVEWRPFSGEERGPLRELPAALGETYAGTLAVEYLCLTDEARRAWLEARMEPTRNRPSLTTDERRGVLERLIAAETFEHVLQARFPGQNRFSLEGAETLIPLLDALVDAAANEGVDEMVIGMPHRGRLNVLAHVLAKPYEAIFAEFEGAVLPPDVQGDGDVKYHLGWSHDRSAGAGRSVHLSLSANPSHLEAIDPVIEGIARAKQAYRDDRERRRVVPLLLHGDAAFTGQGVVFETLALGPLPAFTTGGTIHVIVNNRLGFTTSPGDYLFSRYASGPAALVHAPVFHVNGDDPEAAIQAARLAVGYRQAFGGDVVIDLVCYRRHGHNELDDPTITHPVMYERIRAHPSVAVRYAGRLADAGVIDGTVVAALRRERRAALDEALVVARRDRPGTTRVLAFGGVWKGLGPAGKDRDADTRVDAARLREIAGALRGVPPSFTAHARVAKLFEERHDRVARGEGIDWGTAELLAYGSLLVEGMPVRLSGQDSVRGTFSHRHAVLFDAKDGHAWIPLNHLAPGQAELEPVNSPLSELAVLGFEYGMSSADPRRLVIWEAQFGDFVNAAQVVIDQFIAAAESKWQRASGIVLLLPHGYEGQGAEHSSARLERFLQLCAEDNLQVVHPTTPAQMFHVLRRQMRRPFRTPLVVMTPKSLLRHPRAVSPLTDLAEGRFQRVIDDAGVEPARVQRLLFCSGKVFHVLDEAREQRGIRDIALVRIEELYPFPTADVQAAIARYPAGADVYWVQEEPANQGAWTFVRPLLTARLGGRRLRYAGRAEAASPATGSHAVHEDEARALVADALGSAEAAAAA
jgi:2-oxoglutarate dehydrogenase E1 component